MKQQQHYPVLDGLRGFAAFSVVLFHLGHWLDVPALATNSGLAVDLFFCLSGYVLPLAYGQNKNQNLSAGTFIYIRLVRLMPLTVIATLISSLYVLSRLFVTHQHDAHHSLILAVFLGLFSFPYLNAPKEIGGPQVFPLNGPQYTLFLELFVNFLWFYRRSIFPLFGSILIATVCIVGIAVFGYGGDTTATFWDGFFRVGASFFAGVALFEIDQRLGVVKAVQIIFWPLFVLMALLFFCPYPTSIPVELFWIVLISPLLVFSGSRLSLSGHLKHLCLMGGALSYPIYVLQYPIFCWANGIFQIFSHKQVPLIEIPLIFCATLLLSALALRIYDKPVRRMLSISDNHARAKLTARQRNPTRQFP